MLKLKYLIYIGFKDEFEMFAADKIRMGNLGHACHRDTNIYLDKKKKTTLFNDRSFSI